MNNRVNRNNLLECVGISGTPSQDLSFVSLNPIAKKFATISKADCVKKYFADRLNYN